MTDKASKTKVRVIVLMLWILLAAFYFSLTYAYISASNRDTSLDEYLRYIVVVCGDDRRPTKEVRSLVLAKAEEFYEYALGALTQIKSVKRAHRPLSANSGHCAPFPSRRRDANLANGKRPRE